MPDESPNHGGDAPSDPSGARSSDSVAALIGDTVVLDTAGPTVFLGRLRAVTADGFWLDDADIHDRTDGHATKELYVCEAREHGIRSNRKSLFVCREAVIAVSRLSDVIID